MVPTKLMTVAVMTATMTSTRILSAARFTPMLAARASPRRRAVSCQTLAKSNRMQMRVTAAVMARVCHLALLRAPKSQKRIFCDSSGVAMYCISEEADWKIKSSAMPTSTRVDEEKRRMEAKMNMMPAASMVMRKADSGWATYTERPKVPKTTTSEAPKPAAAAMPRV